MFESLLPSAVRGVARSAAAVAARYHRATLLGAHHLPRGPALLVGNHGLYGYETPVFFYLLLQATRRYPLGLAEHGFFRIPLVRSVLPWLGGVRGTRENAVAALRAGNLVVCYPGGAREVFKSPERRYALRWEHSTGFVRAAAAAGARIIPFAAHGVDDTFALSSSRMPLSADPKYSVPVGVGLGPLPLPARFRFKLGAPLTPPPAAADAATVERFRDRVAHAVRRLLVEAVHA